jgi:positive regulator of sigma E activity
MEERGVVIESSRGTARVRIERSERCEGCPGCMLSDGGDSMIAEAVDRFGVSPGDIVRIETRGATPLRAALLLFLLPLAFLFAGYGAGSGLASAFGLHGQGANAGAGGAVLFFLGSFALLALLTRRKGSAGGPVIVERLGRDGHFRG